MSGFSLTHDLSGPHTPSGSTHPLVIKNGYSRGTAL